MILVLGVWAFVRALLVNSAAVSLENMALRHQLSVLQRSVRRPQIRCRDRIFWLWLSLCLPLIRPIGSRRTPAVFVMESTHAWHCHHPALARRLRTPRLGRIFGQR